MESSLPIPLALEAEARALIRRGNMIGAIKIVRNAIGCPLREAKDLCEGWREQMIRDGENTLSLAACQTTLEDEYVKVRAERDQLAKELAETRAALRPFAHYAEQRLAEPILGLGDSVHAIHIGTPWATKIAFTDCKRALKVLKS